MTRPRAIWRFGTTLVVLVAIAATGLGESVGQRACVGILEAARVAHPDSPSGCARSQSCCCGPRTQPRACGCQQDEERPVPLPTAPDDSGRTLKWTACNDMPHPPVAEVIVKNASSSLGSYFFPTPQRSVQTLLCVWQI
jgi:hypothetical protein